MKKLLIILLMVSSIYSMERDLTKSFNDLELNEKRAVPSLKDLCAKAIATNIDDDFMNQLLNEQPSKQIPVDFAVPIIKHLSLETMSEHDCITPLFFKTVAMQIKKAIIERLAEVGLCAQHQEKLEELQNYADTPGAVKNMIQAIIHDLAQQENMRRFLIKRVYRYREALHIKQWGDYCTWPIEWAPNNQYYVRGSSICNKEGQIITSPIMLHYAWSTDSQCLAGLQGGELVIYDLQGEFTTAVTQDELKGNHAVDIAWSPNKEYIAVVFSNKNADYFLKIWRKTGGCIAHYSNVYLGRVAWSPDSLYIVMASRVISESKIILALEGLSDGSIKSTTLIDNYINSVQWKRDYILISTDHANFLYDKNLNLIKKFNRQCDFVSDGNYFAYIIDDRIQLMVIHQEDPIIFNIARDHWLTDAVWSPDRQELLYNFDRYDMRPFWKLLNYQFSKEERELVQAIVDAEAMGTTKPLATAAQINCFNHLGSGDAQLGELIRDSLRDLCDIRTIPVENDAMLQTH